MLQARLWILALLTLTLISSCDSAGSGEEADEEPEIEAVDGASIPSSTKVLESEALDGLTVDEADSTVLVFSRPTDALRKLKEGDIIVAGVSEQTPYGLLVRAVAVTETVDGLVVRTEQGTLEEAIQEGDLEVRVSLDPQSIEETALQKTGVSLQPGKTATEFVVDLEDVVLLDVDGDPGTEADRILANGFMRFDVDLVFDVSIRRHGMSEARFGTEFELVSDLSVSAGGSASRELEWTVVRYRLSPITFLVGFVPVVITPIVSVVVGVDGSISVGLSTGYSFNANYEAGIERADGDWAPYQDFERNANFRPPSATASASFSAFGRVPVNLLLYGVAGPYASAKGYLAGEVDINGNPWWSLWWGVDVGYGLEVTALSRTLFDYEDPDVIAFQQPLGQADGPATAPAAVVLDRPRNDATSQPRDIVLRWASTDRAETYQVQVDGQQDMSSPFVDRDGLAGLSANVTGLGSGSRYYWRVRGINGAGIGDWSPIWSFTTESPPDIPEAPTLRSPPDNASDQSTSGLTLRWNAPSRAVDYQVQLSRSSQFTSTVFDRTTTSTSTNADGLINSETYFWRVRANNSSGSSGWSSVWSFVTEGAATGTLSGRVSDATTGQPISGVTVRVSGPVNRTDETDLSGDYTIDDLPNGTYSVTASKNGFISDAKNVTVGGSSTVVNFVLSPELQSDEYRIVLTWGSRPQDLDLHFLAESGELIFFRNRGSLTEPPFIALDVDDVDGEGPETITVAQLQGGNVFVNNFSGEFNGSAATLNDSNAEVRVFRGSTLVRTYDVPTSGSGFWWYVFDITNSGELVDQDFLFDLNTGGKHVDEIRTRVLPSRNSK